MKCQAIPEYLLTKGIFNCQKYIAEEKMKFFTTRLSKCIFVDN